MGGLSSQRRTDPAMSSINAFSVEELYSPQFLDSFQENTGYWQEPNPHESQEYLKDSPKWQEIALPNFPQSLRGKDKARAVGKNKGSKAFGSSTMNDDAFARLMVLEYPIPAMPVPNEEQVFPLDVLKTHTAWVKASKEIADLELLQTVKEFHACKQEEGQSEYDGFVQNYNMHSMGKTVSELHAMLKLHEQTLPPKEVSPALHAIRGLRGSKKLKLGALSLYVDDGHRVAVEAIRELHLCLPSILVLILPNRHYAPFITRGMILVSRLYKNGFVNCFENDNSISVSKNNLIFFNAIPRDDIYEIFLSSPNTNDSSMYDVSNKRAKLNLDSALLWHYRLRHISKKRIEKLQLDGLLDSTDIKSFEKRNRTMLDMVHSMMSKTTLLKSFWDYALESDARILNMVPTKKVDKTPNKVWHGQAPKLSYLKVWGCEALVKCDTLTKPNKLESRASSRSLEYLEIIQEEYTHPSIDTRLNHEEGDQEIDEPQSDINPIHRSTRKRRTPDRMCLYIDAEEHESGDLGEPANYKVALLDPESDKWLNAMNVEIQSMKDNEVWELVDLPPNEKTVGHK
nr:hypothetical protein [Tanacetum cinerariifolium]